MVQNVPICVLRYLLAFRFTPTTSQTRRDKLQPYLLDTLYGTATVCTTHTCSIWLYVYPSSYPFNTNQCHLTAYY